MKYNINVYCNNRFVLYNNTPVVRIYMYVINYNIPAINSNIRIIDKHNIVLYNNTPAISKKTTVKDKNTFLLVFPSSSTVAL